MNTRGVLRYALFDWNGVIVGADGNYPIQPDAATALLLYAQHFSDAKMGIVTGRSHEDILRHLKVSGLDLPQLAFIVGEHGGVVYHPRDGSTVYKVDSEPANYLKREFPKVMDKYGRNGYRIEDKHTVFSVELDSSESKTFVQQLVDDLISKKNLPLLTVSHSDSFVEAVHISVDDGYGSGKRETTHEEIEGDWKHAAYTGDGDNDVRCLEAVKFPAGPSNTKPKPRRVIESNNGIIAPFPEGAGTLYIFRTLMEKIA